MNNNNKMNNNSAVLNNHKKSTAMIDKSRIVKTSRVTSSKHAAWQYPN